MEAELHIRDFETGLLGMTLGRLVLADDENGGDLAELFTEWRKNGVWRVTCRVDADAGTLAQLKPAGFWHIKNLVPFRRDTPQGASEAEMELAAPGDEATCVAPTQQAFIQDQLHSDPEDFDWAANRVRSACVRNRLNGRADACLVVRTDGAGASFILCFLDCNQTIVELFAVDLSQRQQRLGTPADRPRQRLQQWPS